MEIKLSDAVAYLASTIKEFDLVFADPPYDLDVAGKLLERVGAVLRPNGLFVLELSSKTENPAPVEGARARAIFRVAPSPKEARPSPERLG